MSWKRAWGEWKWTAAAVGLCLGAFLLNARAWQAGYSARSLTLLACLLLRAPLLLLAAWSVVAVLLAAARKEKTPPRTGLTVLHLAVLVLILPGCAGGYPLWAVVLLVLTALLIAVVYSGRHEIRPAWGRVILRPCLSVLLFVVTWYQCASMTRQALAGLGERIEAHGGADRLRAWATEELAATPRDQQRVLTHDELPTFVDDLMAGGSGARIVRVYNGDDPCVTLITDPGYGFRIRVRPAPAERVPLPWWLGEAGFAEWRPGITLDTVAK